MAASSSSPPPFYPVAPEVGELDQVSVAIDGKLFLTNWRSAADPDVLASHRITHIVAVGAEFVEDSREGIEYWHKDIADDESARAEMSASLRDAANFINKALKAKNGRCLVHCAAGVSRSATCVLAYKLIHEKMSLRAAFQDLLAKRRVIWPNNGFMQALIALEGEANAGKTSVTLEEYVAWGDYEGPTPEPDIDLLRQKSSTLSLDGNGAEAEESIDERSGRSSIASSSTSSKHLSKEERVRLAERESKGAVAARKS